MTDHIEDMFKGNVVGDTTSVTQKVLCPAEIMA